MKHKGIKKKSEPFIGMIKRTTRDSTQVNSITHKRETLSHSIKALYIRVVRSV